MQETAESIKAKSTALRLIARAEQCSAGLTRKLEKRGFDSTCVSGVISGLCESNLIDDNRFARFWLQSRLHFTRSPRQLLSSLCARGIDRDDAQDALKSV
ncbi:MAG: recombination regulator RecX, partial [Treponema sp.]|nr:recombination regulator RecX [Treponema sp.]